MFSSFIGLQVLSELAQPLAMPRMLISFQIYNSVPIFLSHDPQAPAIYLPQDDPQILPQYVKSITFFNYDSLKFLLLPCLPPLPFFLRCIIISYSFVQYLLSSCYVPNTALGLELE